MYINWRSYVTTGPGKRASDILKLLYPQCILQVTYLVVIDVHKNGEISQMIARADHVTFIWLHQGTAIARPCPICSAMQYQLLLCYISWARCSKGELRYPRDKSLVFQRTSMGYWPSVRSRWLDIGRVRIFFACLWTSTPSRSINLQEKNNANIQSSWPNKLSQ